MRVIALFIGLFACLCAFAPPAAADTPAVKAVLFFSTNCGHCHYVIEEVLPPLFEQYGDQLQIIGVEISTAEGQDLYRAAITSLEIPESQRGVPTLIVGETVLVGSVDIPERFPGMIAEGLTNGGIDWPEFPGMETVLASVEEQAEAAADPTIAPPEAAAVAATLPATAAATIAPTPVPTALPATEPAPEAEVLAAAPPVAASEGVLSLYADPAAGESAGTATVRDRLMRDPAGNMLSILVLVGMAAALAYSLVRFWRAGSITGLQLAGWPQWALLGLFLVGLGVAAYMAFVETTQTVAVCGPVGDCNTVQQSEYATLFGFLPVGVVGIVGYLALMLAWAVRLWGPYSWRSVAGMALVGMALFGVLFSIYLTFLEPFVIGATCLWCLSSALIMTAILLVLVAALPTSQPAAVWQAEA